MQVMVLFDGSPTDRPCHHDEQLQQAVLAHFGALALNSTDLNKILMEARRPHWRSSRTDLAAVVELSDNGQTLLIRAGIGWQPKLVGVLKLHLSPNGRG